MKTHSASQFNVRATVTVNRYTEFEYTIRYFSSIHSSEALLNLLFTHIAIKSFASKALNVIAEWELE